MIHFIRCLVLLTSLATSLRRIYPANQLAAAQTDHIALIARLTFVVTFSSECVLNDIRSIESSLQRQPNQAESR